MNKTRIRKVAVALRLSFASHRDILQGVTRFAKAHHWQLQLVPIPDSFSPVSLDRLARKGLDGFITSEVGNPEAAAFFRKFDRPLVLVGSCGNELPGRRRNLALVKVDDRSIGDAGARFLSSLGRFRSFGFVPENVRNACSTLRLDGFRKSLALRHGQTFAYPPQPYPNGTEEDIEALSAWLKTLPKPAAVMAVFDLRATHVIEAAQRADIRIPQQLVVLGVDNDEILCDFTEPPLSSVAPDFVGEGDLAAKTLDALMRKRKTGVFRMTLKTKRLVRRGSTAPISPSALIVDRALAFIRQHALDGIGAHDVVRHLCVSRRLADRRFREATGSSILETILSIRLKALREKLAKSDETVALLAEQCGFRSENYAKNLFKRRFGLSMSSYRKSLTASKQAQHAGSALTGPPH